MYTFSQKQTAVRGFIVWLRLCYCRKWHPCADSLWHCAGWAETPFQSCVSSIDHSPILYWILTDAFWELTLQWGCVVGVHEAKVDFRMEQLWLTVGVCWRGFICCFSIVLLLQGSLVGTKESCTVERAFSFSSYMVHAFRKIQERSLDWRLLCSELWFLGRLIVKVWQVLFHRLNFFPVVMKSQLFVFSCTCLARGNCLCLVFSVQMECSFLLLIVFFSRRLATRRKARNFLSSNLAWARTLA